MFCQELSDQYSGEYLLVRENEEAGYNDGGEAAENEVGVLDADFYEHIHAEHDSKEEEDEPIKIVERVAGIGDDVLNDVVLRSGLGGGRRNACD